MSEDPKRNPIASVLVFGFCALAEVLVWLASSRFLGEAELWDAHGGLYFGCLLAIGIISGAIARAGTWPVGLGSMRANSLAHCWQV